MAAQVEIKLCRVANHEVNNSSCATIQIEMHPTDSAMLQVVADTCYKCHTATKFTTNQEECFHSYQSSHASHEPQGIALYDAFSGQPQK